jgi:CAAX prenyl protease-like protein
MHEPDRSNATLLARHRWVPFVLPLLVYMLAAELLEPSQPDPLPATTSTDPAELEARRQIQRESGSASLLGLTILYEYYPIVYTIKIALTVAVLALVWPAYRQWPLHVSWLAIAVGAVGVVVWVGLCHLGLEARLLNLLGWGGLGERPGYNPLEQLKDSPLWAYSFLAIRFVGLVLVVPVIEEMFYRAWLMRVVMDDSPWWQIPFGVVDRKAVAVGILVPALVHPGEILAAVAWFGMVTWLMIRTKNIWDCVAAHAATNLLLGIYVLAFEEWQLW